MFGVLLHFLLTGVALAGPDRVQIVSAPVPEREALELAGQVAEAHGWEGKVVRRVDAGEASYTLVIGGFPDQESAQRAAALMAEQASMGFSVAFKGRGPRSGDTAPEPAAEEPAPAEFGASDALDRASEALGGPKAGLAALNAQPRLLFRYERTVRADGVTITSRQEWMQQGADLRLRTEVTEGPGVSSLTLVVGDQAWVVAGDRTEPRDVARTREVLSGWSPEQLLSYPLRFAELVATDPAWQTLRLLGEEDCEVGRCWVLEGDSAAGSLRLVLDAKAGLPVELALGQGDTALRYSFSGWKRVDAGAMVPMEVQLSQGGQVLEVLRVLELSAPRALPADAFSPPQAP